MVEVSIAACIVGNGESELTDALKATTNQLNETTTELIETREALRRTESALWSSRVEAAGLLKDRIRLTTLCVCSECKEFLPVVHLADDWYDDEIPFCHTCHSMKMQLPPPPPPKYDSASYDGSKLQSIEEDAPLLHPQVHRVGCLMDYLFEASQPVAAIQDHNRYFLMPPPPKK